MSSHGTEHVSQLESAVDIFWRLQKAQNGTKIMHYQIAIQGEFFFSLNITQDRPALTRILDEMRLCRLGDRGICLQNARERECNNCVSPVDTP